MRGVFRSSRFASLSQVVCCIQGVYSTKGVGEYIEDLCVPWIFISEQCTSRMKRRTFLGAAVSSTVVATAGCLGDDDSYATIQRFHLLNSLEESAVMEIRIEQSETGNRVHDDQYELPPGGDGFDGITLDCLWPDEPLKIDTRRESDDSWNTFVTTDYEDCLLFAVELNQSGTSYLYSHEDCPVRSPDCHDGAG